MDDIMKDNFKVKKPVELEQKDENAAGQLKSHEIISQELKKRAMGCIGGSMVYVDRENLEWNGDDES